MRDFITTFVLLVGALVAVLMLYIAAMLISHAVCA